MRRASHSEREKFVALIQQHAGGDPTQRYSFAQRLMRYGATYGRLCEDECNGPDYDAVNRMRFFNAADRNKALSTISKNWQDYLDTLPAKESKIEDAVSNLCKLYGCKAVFSGDPRGNTIKITVPDGYTNDWGREGIGVPTS